MTTRKQRTQHALATLGVSVVYAGLTTMVAAFALYWGEVQFFNAFGTFLFCTMFFALVYSLIFFAAALMIMGPTYAV